VKRLLTLIFGLAVAAAALYMLFSGGPAPRKASEPPSAEIDAASRAKLERVLETAETERED
jgi:uncharacterized membrane protein YfcA